MLDHLKRVSLKADVNKMTTQNLAVCFGPVLLCPSPNSATDMDAIMDFKRHVEVLHYLLDIWPGNRGSYIITNIIYLYIISSRTLITVTIYSYS